jgi:NADPH-dependent 2,4-dienoyl-CoA reductase/sulfur reductase-like enzyme
MSSGPRHVVLVGGGLASVVAIECLRAEGYDGTIRLVSEEADLPYDRPPLSKAYLSGEKSPEEIRLHDAQWYDAMRVDLVLGQAASALDPIARHLVLADGWRLPYDALLLATGARARQLPAHVCAPDVPVHVLRNRADADRLKQALVPGHHVVLIGGGVIGMEVAATLQQHGCAVTVLEGGDRIMARFFLPALSQLLAQQHARRGVQIRTGVRIDSVLRQGDTCRIALGDGTTLEAHAVVVGIGCDPNAGWLASSGLALHAGAVRVDARGETSAPGVYATGDMAAFPLPNGQLTRWENWTHARLHAAHAARHMLGKGGAYEEIPWVWSDQFDMNLQVFGCPSPDLEMVRRGRIDDGRMTAFHLRQGMLVGATLINDARHKMPLRKLLARGARLDPALLADPAVDLKKLAANLATTHD